jgi:hypothetical protein
MRACRPAAFWNNAEQSHPSSPGKLPINGMRRALSKERDYADEEIIAGTHRGRIKQQLQGRDDDRDRSWGMFGVITARSTQKVKL